MLKILIGGSPCTHWSIAQTRNRETAPDGIGWELFQNFVVAKKKFKPDFFLYENNKSAAQAIKYQICEELRTDLMYINSSLVSAQNRERFYCFNWTVPQPADRGIILKDILQSGENLSGMEKSYCLTASYGGAAPKNTIVRKQRTMIAEPILPIRIGSVGGSSSQGNRVYSCDGKSVCLSGNGGGWGANTGLYAVPTDGYAKKKKVYCVENGLITIDGFDYPIKLQDGYYIIRKLTPIECERLQTLPDNYTKLVSNSQRYKALGNGWTAEVIIHILKGALGSFPRNTEIMVLSLYDGIATGRYCLKKMGFTNVTYHAYEINKYAAAIAKNNFPDIIQHGNAFDIRQESWRCG